MAPIVPTIAALRAILGTLLAGNGLRRVLGRRAGSPGKAADGIQEVAIRVQAGFHPSTIRVRAGRPVRIVFFRVNDDPCLARVFLSEPPLTRRLVPFGATAVTFTPHRVGDHLFTCEEGRFCGHLIVEPASSR
jgi:plastocyanin domain-containing protein